jgi:hypothetical protein
MLVSRAVGTSAARIGTRTTVSHPWGIAALMASMTMDALHNEGVNLSPACGGRRLRPRRYAAGHVIEQDRHKLAVLLPRRLRWMRIDTAKSSSAYGRHRA